MGKYIFTISYDINPEKREHFLALIQEMKQHIVNGKGKNYSVFEQKGKQNSFTEMYVCENKEEFDQLDDQDDKSVELINKLEEYLVDKKMKYTTFMEL